MQPNMLSAVVMLVKLLGGLRRLDAFFWRRTKAAEMKEASMAASAGYMCINNKGGPYMGPSVPYQGVYNHVHERGAGRSR